jgi:hypothetical protein
MQMAAFVVLGSQSLVAIPACESQTVSTAAVTSARSTASDVWCFNHLKVGVTNVSAADSCAAAARHPGDGR